MELKKFHQTQMAGIRGEYDTMRNNLSLVTVFYLFEYFKFKHILEIGFYEGQTFGLMLESTEKNSSLTAIDIDFKYDLFNKYYADSQYTKDKIIKLLNIDIRNFVPEKNYDFINIDVADGAEARKLRVKTACFLVNYMEKNGVIMWDNFKNYSDDIDVFLKMNHNFVPFLNDDQALYFHHREHDASHFLDTVITNSLYDIASTNNVDYKGFLVKQIETIRVPLDQEQSLFLDYCINNDI
jgi:hypothetical protein